METADLQFDGNPVDRRREATLAFELLLLLALGYGSSFWLPLNGASLREIILLGTLALAAGAALLATGRAPQRVRAVWWIVPAVCLLWIAAEAGRLTERYYGASTDTQWLTSGAIALAVYFLLLLAALRAFASSSAIAWSLGLLDAAVVAVAVFAPWLEYVLPRLNGAGGRALLPALLAPALAAVVLVAISFAVYASTVQPTWSYLFLAAIVAGLVGDVMLARHLLAGGGFTKTLDGWEGRALLVLVAAACVGGATRPHRRRLIGLGIARLGFVIVAYSAALTYAVFAFARGKQLGGFMVVSAISVLLTLRLLVHAFERYRHSQRLVQALREQEQLAVMDSLTGLYNRRFLDAELQLELGRGARSQKPVGILLCDLDHFKQVNDSYGHLVGDSVLREVARRLLGAVRNGDLVARYGGEEFVVLLPGGDKELLKEIGERCRLAFDEAPFYLPGGHRAVVTISIGGACWPEDASSARSLFEAADSALYWAKEQGRNRIFISESEADRAMPEIGLLMLTPDMREHPEEAELELAAEGQATDVPAEAEGPVTTGEAAEHEERMERWAELVARALGLDEQAQQRCALAARFRDVGKSSLPESILDKPGPLSEIEWEFMQEHPERGAALVELVPEFGCVGSIIREHHERFDGRGYPSGKSRDEISTEACIVACCDAWSAMRSDRPYARAMTVGEARAELLAGRGKQFDPDVVMAFLMLGENDPESRNDLLTSAV